MRVVILFSVVVTLVTVVIVIVMAAVTCVKVIIIIIVLTIITTRLELCVSYGPFCITIGSTMLCFQRTFSVEADRACVELLGAEMVMP